MNESLAQDPPKIREVDNEEGTKGVDVSFYVLVPPDPLLGILWNPKYLQRLFPDIRQISVLADHGTSLELSYRVDAVLKEVGYVLRRTRDDSTRTISWREIAGDLRRVRGHWRVTPSGLEAMSLVHYATFVDVGRFVPTALVRNLAMRKIDEMVTRVRRVTGEIQAEELALRG